MRAVVRATEGRVLLANLVIPPGSSTVWRTSTLRSFALEADSRKERRFIRFAARISFGGISLDSAILAVRGVGYNTWKYGTISNDCQEHSPIFPSLARFRYDFLD